MNQSALPRPPPIPASPHLKQSFTLQMVHDEARAMGGNQQWPPIRQLPGAPRPHDFLTKCAVEGGKRIAWPPHLSSTEDLTIDQEGSHPSYPGERDPHSDQNSFAGMNQQTSSTHQTSSTSVNPGGGFHSTSSVYQSKEYQYEQHYGGYQTQVKTIPAQQGYALPQQQQYSLQSGFNEFQIPIQKEFNQPSQQQSFNTATNFVTQNQLQSSQHEQTNLHNQGQHLPPLNIQNQINQPQGQFQGQIPQSQVHFQIPQSKPPVYQGGTNLSGNKSPWQVKPEASSKQGQVSGVQQNVPPKALKPSIPRGISIQQPGEEIEWPPKNDSGPNLTTVYPSGFKLKEEAPMDHSVGAQIVPSQPAFKITQPVKMRGDDKWPPRKGGAEDTTQEEVREFIKPKKSNRDYSEFFAQNALPNNYPGYRAPPGTQHHSGEE